MISGGSCDTEDWQMMLKIQHKSHFIKCIKFNQINAALRETLQKQTKSIR